MDSSTEDNSNNTSPTFECVHKSDSTSSDSSEDFNPFHGTNPADDPDMQTFLKIVLANFKKKHEQSLQAINESLQVNLLSSPPDADLDCGSIIYCSLNIMRIVLEDTQENISEITEKVNQVYEIFNKSLDLMVEKREEILDTLENVRQSFIDSKGIAVEKLELISQMLSPLPQCSNFEQKNNAEPKTTEENIPNLLSIPSTSWMDSMLENLTSCEAGAQNIGTSGKGQRKRWKPKTREENIPNLLSIPSTSWMDSMLENLTSCEAGAQNIGSSGKGQRKRWKPKTTEENIPNLLSIPSTSWMDSMLENLTSCEAGAQNIGSSGKGQRKRWKPKTMEENIPNLLSIPSTSWMDSMLENLTSCEAGAQNIGSSEPKTTEENMPNLLSIPSTSWMDPMLENLTSCEAGAQNIGSSGKGQRKRWNLNKFPVVSNLEKPFNEPLFYNDFTLMSKTFKGTLKQISVVAEKVTAILENLTEILHVMMVKNHKLILHMIENVRQSLIDLKGVAVDKLDEHIPPMLSPLPQCSNFEKNNLDVHEFPESSGLPPPDAKSDDDCGTDVFADLKVMGKILKDSVKKLSAVSQKVIEEFQNLNERFDLTMVENRKKILDLIENVRQSLIDSKGVAVDKLDEHIPPMLSPLPQCSNCEKKNLEPKTTEEKMPNLQSTPSTSEIGSNNLVMHPMLESLNSCEAGDQSTDSSEIKAPKEA